MRISKIARQLPSRVAVGAFILNSGLGKWGADEEHAAGIHGMAVGSYPFLGKLPAAQFARLLSIAEISLGAALLIPVVPGVVAGAGLTAFSGGLLGLYLRTEGMHEPGSVKPTPQGIGLAKDVWMLGVGLSLLVDDLVDRGC
jgi:uncharacterized membrane protein YphA (DoxX/SURF4 family)